MLKYFAEEERLKWKRASYGFIRTVVQEKTGAGRPLSIRPGRVPKS